MTREEAINEIKSWDFLNKKESEAVQTLIPELREKPLTPFQQCLNCILRGVYYAEVPDEKVNEFIVNIVKTRTDELIKLAKRHEYTDCQFRESEDERIINQLIALVNSAGEILLIPTNKEELVDWLKKQKEQKPVDYDHEMWKNCVANFEGGKKEVIEHPERYGLQTPAEWSEEDEKMRYFVTEAVQSRYSDRELSKYIDPGIIKEKKQLKQSLFDWLKSLRPSWKPSKEQMKVLDEAFMKSDNEKYRQAISSLYYDLQKL